ncbi:hypothetical protein GEV33_014250 [Tenebrio molitor]|uniref:Peptidase S1 domain-containing protein n=1 Tax=Tenebrio molitor TaxID=7067 RepID=A0A8J6GYN2_TENMO|nr:hypothetical protein GEV33_014250 [Tenebrio molitor]
MMKIIVTIFVCVTASMATPVNVDSNIDWRVVGGSTATPHQFPFIVSLRTPYDSHNCGGSIIAKNYVITAAHCVSGYAPSYYTVVAGTNQLNATNPLRLKVAQIIVHPEYSSSLILNDVALLRLETPVEESEEVQIVGLETEYVDTVRDCVLVGWGRTSYPGSIPNDLQFLNERTYPNDECVNRWASAHAVYSSQICTLTKVGEGACHGDSGGPLVVVKDDKFSLIALVSWGSPCARGMPDVYTRVASFHEFITDNIKN